MIILNPLYNHEQSTEISENITKFFKEKIQGTDNELKFKSQIHDWLNDEHNRVQPNDRTFIRAIIFGRTDVF